MDNVRNETADDAVVLLAVFGKAIAIKNMPRDFAVFATTLIILIIAMDALFGTFLKQHPIAIYAKILLGVAYVVGMGFFQKRFNPINPRWLFLNSGEVTRELLALNHDDFQSVIRVNNCLRSPSKTSFTLAMKEIEDSSHNLQETLYFKLLKKTLVKI